MQINLDWTRDIKYFSIICALHSLCKKHHTQYCLWLIRKIPWCHDIFAAPVFYIICICYRLCIGGWYGCGCGCEGWGGLSLCIRRPALSRFPEMGYHMIFLIYIDEGFTLSIKPFKSHSVWKLYSLKSIHWPSKKCYRLYKLEFIVKCCTDCTTSPKYRITVYQIYTPYRFTKLELVHRTLKSYANGLHDQKLTQMTSCFFALELRMRIDVLFTKVN